MRDDKPRHTTALGQYRRGIDAADYGSTALKNRTLAGRISEVDRIYVRGCNIERISRYGRRREQSRHVAAIAGMLWPTTRKSGLHTRVQSRADRAGR